MSGEPQLERSVLEGKERDKPKGPIKQRPISSLYDVDEDWRALDAPVDPSANRTSSGKV